MREEGDRDQQEKAKPSKRSFQIFQPIGKQPSALTFPGQPSELMEMLRKNPGEQQSFKLQPSIINVSAFRDVDKPNISDFSTHINSKAKRNNPSALKKSNNAGKQEYKASIEQFDIKGRSDAPACDDATKQTYHTPADDEDTEVKRQLKARQFDSETEDVADYQPTHTNAKANLCFIAPDHMSMLNKKISKGSKKVFELLSFVKRRDNETNDVKTYACKYCPKVFARRAALGGHTAKNHPQQSDSYRIRQESLKNRKIERERFDYFKTIENK